MLNYAASYQTENFYAKSLQLNGLNGTSAQNFVDYWFETAKNNTRVWYFHIDIHGGKHSSVATSNIASTSYAPSKCHDLQSSLDFRPAWSCWHRSIHHSIPRNTHAQCLFGRTRHSSSTQRQTTPSATLSLGSPSGSCFAQSRQTSLHVLAKCRSL